MFDLFGSQVDTPLPALELDDRPVSDEQMLAWEKEVLGVYVSEHPFRAAAHDLAPYTTHNAADLTLDAAGQSVTIAGMVSGVQRRTTRDGRRFYVVDFEDLSGNAELTVWSDVLEQTGDEIWASGQILLVSLECRDRGDRLGLTVRKAALYDRAEGRVVGFTPEQWQVEAPRVARPAPAKRRSGETAKRRDGESATVVVVNGVTAPADPSGATTEAARPGVQPPVNGDVARLVVTIYETEDAVADEALLGAVARILRQAPGSDAVRLVVHDSAGQDSEFDLPRAAVSDDLVQSIRAVLRSSGTVRQSSARTVAAG
jgi:DNA polymerase-3 subunit alpha